MLMMLKHLKNIIEKHKLRRFNMEIIDAGSGGTAFQTIGAFYCCF